MPDIIAEGPWGEGGIILPNDVAGGLLYTLMLEAEQSVPPKPCKLDCRVFRSSGEVFLAQTTGVSGRLSVPFSPRAQFKLAITLLRCRLSKKFTFKVTFRYGSGGGDGHEQGSQWSYNRD